MSKELLANNEELKEKNLILESQNEAMSKELQKLKGIFINIKLSEQIRDQFVKINKDKNSFQLDLNKTNPDELQLPANRRNEP